MQPTESHSPGEIPRDVAELLNAYAAPTAPTTPEALLARLRPLLPAPVVRRFRPDGLSASPQLSALRYFAAQVWLFRPGWWLGTLAATALGLYLTSALGLAPGLVAPPLVALGLAYSFREAGTPAWEIELACPIQPYQVMLARTAVVLAWVTGLGTVSALIFGLTGLGDWLAGMLLFTGGSLLVMLLTGPRLGAALGLVAWLMLMLRHANLQAALRQSAVNTPSHLWGLNNPTAALAGALALALSLLLSPRLRHIDRQEE